MTELFPGLSEAEFELAGIFYPRMMERAINLLDNSGRLVHYTTAEVAVSIIENQEIWMRNASTMNDWSEVEHGLMCLRTAWKDNKASDFKTAIDHAFPNLTEELETFFDSWQSEFRNNTFLTCLSEHHPLEDQTGRLSMWRAYGGRNGIALVLKSHPFAVSSDTLKANASPVEYLSGDEFEAAFQSQLDGILRSREKWTSISRDDVLGYLFYMLKFLALCTKHPGFSEEREWRIVYSPSGGISPAITPAIKVVRGTPQLIQKIPLLDRPDLGLFGASAPQLLDRVIIGPTDHPVVVYQAFVDLLGRAGVESPQTKVVISNIPLRY